MISVTGVVWGAWLTTVTTVHCLWRSERLSTCLLCAYLSSGDVSGPSAVRQRNAHKTCPSFYQFTLATHAELKHTLWVTLSRPRETVIPLSMMDGGKGERQGGGGGGRGGPHPRPGAA